MKRHGLILLVIFLFTIFAAQSQVVVSTDPGATPDPSAILDIQSPDKGLLIPRMVISDLNSSATPVDSPVEGMLIYNTTASPTIPIGFYYWTENKWSPVLGASSSIIQEWSAAFYYAAELWEDNPWGSPTSISLPIALDWYGWSLATMTYTFGSPAPVLQQGTPDKLIVHQDGLYQVSLNVSASGTNNFQVETAIWHDPAGATPAYRTRVRFLSKLLSAGDLWSGAATGLLPLHDGDALYLMFRGTTSGESIKIHNINITVNKVGDI